MKNFNKKLAVGATSLALTASSFAAGPDLSPITSGIDMGTVITAVLAIAVTLGGVRVAISGARKVLGMIR